MNDSLYSLARETTGYGETITIMFNKSQPHHVVKMDDGGGMSIAHTRPNWPVYIYFDEAPSVAQAFAELVQKRQAALGEARAEFENRIRTDRVREPGTDLSTAETFEALTLCPTRLGRRGPEIFYNDVWLSLCRTDLKDDVATGGKYLTAAGLRNAIQYGARITQTYFAVIDAFSDG